MSLTIRSTMNNQAAAQGLNDAGKVLKTQVNPRTEKQLMHRNLI